MKPAFLFVGGAVVLMLATPLRAETSVAPGFPALDPFDTLQKTLRAEREAKARAPGGSTGGGREMYATTSYLEGIRQSLSRGDEQSALNALVQLEAAASTPEVRHACEALVEKINKDRTAHEQAFNAELEATIKRAGEVVLKAKEARELDALIEEFNRLSEARASLYSDGRDNRATQKLQGAVSFLSRWQEYLIALSKGDDQSAANALRNVTENGYNHTQLIPRSEILARMPGSRDSSGEPSSGRANRTAQEISAAVADILDHTRSLDDISAALGQLNDLGGKNGNNSSNNTSTDLGSAVASLQTIQKTRSELNAGLVTTISLNTLRPDSGTRSNVESKLTGLRAELINLALPRLLNAADEKPAAGEGVNDFLRRLTAAAKKRGDWASVVRSLDFSRNLASNQNGYSVSNTQEADAFKQFFAGSNLEAAGQYFQAVLSYLNALKSGAQDLPVAVIGEHLAAIEKAHPKEFAEANAYALNPPSQQNNPYPYGAPGTMDPRLRRSGYPGGYPNYPGAPEQPTPPVTITVPAASPTPSPTPAATPPAAKAAP